MSTAAYHFVSHWRIPAPSETVAEAILASEDWQTWWRGLETVVVHHEAHGVSSAYSCTWRSASGYALTTRIEVTEYEKDKLICFNSSGDLIGDGRFEMEPTAQDATKITIYWNVSATKQWMNWLSPILRPLFIANHHALMAKGEQGLTKDITSKRRSYA